MTQTGTGGIGYGPTLPATCSPGDLFVTTTIPAISLGVAIDKWAMIANVVAEISATTTDNTQTTVFAFPVPTNHAFLITAEFVCARSDFSTGLGGTSQAIVMRNSGNVLRSGAQVKNMPGAMSGTLDLEANTGTQTMDVKIRGEGTQTDVWKIRVYAYPLI